MFQSNSLDSFFVDAVMTLKPYLNDLVCIGGCANALYRYHEHANNITLPYIGTKDLDWASPQKILKGNRKSIAELMAGAGFREEILGTDKSAVIKYLPKGEGLGADLEFLCPESGLPGGRNQNSLISSHTVQLGLMAQPLRYLELLQYRTWDIELGRIPEFAKLSGLRVRVPNPAAYVVQKVLIRDQRRSAQSVAKDCYYIYEVSVIFRDSMDYIAQESNELRIKYKAWLKKFPTMAGALFASENAEGTVSALRVFKETRAALGSRGDELSAEMIHRAVTKMLSAMK